MLQAGCPRCPLPVTETTGRWTCLDHGPVAPLWRPREASYEAFVEHLEHAEDFPTYLPWPMAPGWQVSDFGVVVEPGRSAKATISCCTGSSALDGPVDAVVVSEEPGTGLGARAARLPRPDPDGVGEGPPLTRIRVETASVPLWAVTTSGADEEFDRCVVVGEAAGRWLWLVLRPASAMLLLREQWILRDVSGMGAPLVEVAFGGPPPPW